MKVYYRMCGIPSTNPSPWKQDDKFGLNKVCLKSFVEAYRDIKPEVHFILDYCDKSYSEMIDDIVPFDFEIEFTEMGINNTMLRSYELASQVDDVVLFQECDYLYRPNIGKLMVQAVEKFKLVSPYDHLNFYIDRNLHSENCRIDLVNHYHFRSTERDTMTWACHSKMVKENLGILVKHGYLDDVVWRDLLIAGYQLWVPIPSFATHLVKDFMAPGVDWEKIWQKYQ